jgi:hypothetical protein
MSQVNPSGDEFTLLLQAEKRVKAYSEGPSRYMKK